MTHGRCSEDRVFMPGFPSISAAVVVHPNTCFDAGDDLSQIDDDGLSVLLREASVEVDRAEARRLAIARSGPAEGAHHLEDGPGGGLSPGDRRRGGRRPGCRWPGPRR